MPRTFTTLLTVSSIALFFAVSGCSTTPPDSTGMGDQTPTAEVAVNFGAGAEDIQIEAGTSKRLRGTAEIPTASLAATAGTLRLDTSSITFTPADQSDQTGGKITPQQQTANTIEITISLAGSNQQDTVCEEGQMFGPFLITLDEDLQPVSVTPSSVVLTDDTIALLNTGSVTLCVDILSTISGTIRINNFIFNLEF